MQAALSHLQFVEALLGAVYSDAALRVHVLCAGMQGSEGLHWVLNDCTGARSECTQEPPRDEWFWHCTCASLLLSTLCRTWAQMVSRFEALLQCYREHCVSRTAMLLHLHSTDPLSVQEVGRRGAEAALQVLLAPCSDVGGAVNGQISVCASSRRSLCRTGQHGGFGLLSCYVLSCPVLC